MNRSLLRALGLAALLALAACGDDSATDDGAAEPADDIADALLSEPPAIGAADAAAIMEEWAAPLRDAGYRIDFEAGGALLTALTIASPDGGAVWSSASARVVEADAGALVLAPEGPQQLTLNIGDRSLSAAFEAAALRVAAGSGELRFAFADVTNDHGTIGTFDVTARPSPESATLFELAAGDYIIAPDRAGPLGPEIESMTATLDGTTAANGDIVVSSLALHWGLLELEATGTIALDDSGAVSGRFDAAITDILAVLDAIRASVALDRGAMAEIYAAILEEMGAAPEVGAREFQISVDAGAVTLLGEERGIPDLELGVLAPFLAGRSTP